jgi:antitoxin VapB
VTGDDGTSRSFPFIASSFDSSSAVARKKHGCILPGIMALNIKDDTADRLARELAAATGEGITTAVTTAVRERLERVQGSVPHEQRVQALTEIATRSSGRRILDRRSADEILGYGPDGLPA